MASQTVELLPSVNQALTTTS